MPISPNTVVMTQVGLINRQLTRRILPYPLLLGFWWIGVNLCFLCCYETSKKLVRIEIEQPQKLFRIYWIVFVTAPIVDSCPYPCDFSIAKSLSHWNAICKLESTTTIWKIIVINSAEIPENLSSLFFVWITFIAKSQMSTQNSVSPRIISLSS